MKILVEEYDEFGNVLYNMNVNNESNGRYHTDWLNMMYSRLKISRELLTDDGVIYISIDDNELENLRKVCNEIFGENNFVANVVWIKKYGIQNDARYYSNSHDYIVVYAKNKDHYSQNLLPRTSQQDSRYKNPDNDPRGAWKAADFSVPHHSDNRVYEITLPSGRKVRPSQGRSWGASEEEFAKLVNDNRIWFGKNNDSVPSLKKFLSEVKDGITATTIWGYEEVGHTDKAKKELDVLFEGATVFDYPKPVDLIKKIVLLSTQKDSIVLDFFSGSSTTAHAVMKQNAEDEGCRKMISVQIPDNVAEKSMAYKNGYLNICEIAKERIRRAGSAILEESKSIVDVGFRVLKIDSSNMKSVYYNPSEIQQQSLFESTDNIKEDRTPEDLLFQVMLDLGVPLSSKIEETEIAGKKVFNVDDGFLVACFDSNVTEEAVKAVAQMKPYYAVFRDSSMATDSVATNFDQIFETYSPSTVRKVL